MHFTWLRLVKDGNPYRDENGQFASADGDAGSGHKIGPSGSTGAYAQAVSKSLPKGYSLTVENEAEGGGVLFSAKIKNEKGKTVGTVKRIFGDDSDTVEHEELVLDKSLQGKGLGTIMFKDQVEAYKAMGVTTITTRADKEAGPYTWAKIGFLPTKEAWDSIKDTLTERVLETLEPEDAMALGDAIDLEGPKAIWAVADHPKGKQLLKGVAYDATFKLNNKSQMNRMNAAVKKLGG